MSKWEMPEERKEEKEKEREEMRRRGHLYYGFATDPN